MGSAPSSLPPRRRPGGALVKDVGEEKSSLLWSGLVGGVAAGSALVDVCRVGALAGCPQGQGERQVPWSWPGCGSSCLPVEKVGRCECSCSRGSLLLYAIATLGVGWGGVFGAASVPCPGPIYSSSLLFDSGAARTSITAGGSTEMDSQRDNSDTDKSGNPDSKPSKSTQAFTFLQQTSNDGSFDYERADEKDRKSVV